MRIALALYGLLVLAGCAHIEPALESRPFEDRLITLQTTPYWQMRGRIAVDTGDDAWQARFNWWQDGDGLRLLIRGPLNIGAVEVSGTTERLTLRTRGDSWVLEDPETDLMEILGWWLPVSSLSSWLLGIPDPHHPSEQVMGPDNLLVYLGQRTWELHFDAYAPEENLMIPERIRLNHSPLDVIVTVDNWSTERPIARQTLN